MLKRVVKTVEEMPLWRLQVIGKKPNYFLYEHKLEDNAIRLKKGIAYCFRRFHPMIVRMLQGAWVDEVRTLKKNQPTLGQRRDLTEFLFGSERESLTAYQPILRELQDGFCFYCRHRIKAAGAVDHFIPWARYPLDLGHNFVLAHPKCNSDKSDHLAALPHLRNWCKRNTVHEPWLSEQFDKKGLLHDLNSTMQIAIWSYALTENTGGTVWLKGNYVLALESGWLKLF